jgi:hypothetical protein
VNAGSYTIAPNGVSSGSLTFTSTIKHNDSVLGAFVQNNATVVQFYDVSNTLVEDITIQNTRGLGILFSQTSRSGIRNSVLNNVGNYGLGPKVSSIPFDHQAIDFCCGIASKNQGNFAIGNRIIHTGLDSIAIANQSNFVVSDNWIVESSTPRASGFIAAGIWGGGGNNGIEITGNSTFGAMGSGMDIGDMTNVVIADNVADLNGSCGITLTPGSVDITLRGNETRCNGQDTGAGIGYESPYNGGICLAGTSSDVASRNVKISGNIATDTQRHKTQKYGVEVYSSFGLVTSDIQIDYNNSFSGNLISALGGTATYMSNSSEK